MKVGTLVLAAVLLKSPCGPPRAVDPGPPEEPGQIYGRIFGSEQVTGFRVWPYLGQPYIDSEGYFAFVGLTPGTYRIQSFHAGGRVHMLQHLGSPVSERFLFEVQPGGSVYAGSFEFFNQGDPFMSSFELVEHKDVTRNEVWRTVQRNMKTIGWKGRPLQEEQPPLPPRPSAERGAPAKKSLPPPL